MGAIDDERVSPLLRWLAAETEFPQFYWRSRNGSLEAAAVGKEWQGSLEDIELSPYGPGFPEKQRLGIVLRPFPAQKRAEEMSERSQEAWWESEQVYSPRKAVVRSGGRIAPYPEGEWRNAAKREEDSFGLLPFLLERTDSPQRSQWCKNLSRFLHSERLDQEMEKVVPARVTDYLFDGVVPIFSLAAKLFAAESNAYHFLFRPNAKEAFVGASPERLLFYENGHIFGEAVAGTIAIENGFVSQSLLGSKKNSLEHDFVRDELSRGFNAFCDPLFLRETEVLQQRRVAHLHTEFSGPLRSPVSLRELLERIHPSSALSGLPRKKALSWLAAQESFSRGLYAGAIGLWTDSLLELCVGIRSHRVQANTVRSYTGAGIVRQSIPEEEWDELNNKLAFMDELFARKSLKDAPKSRDVLYC